jgi:Aspartyl protease/PDZ domain
MRTHPDCALSRGSRVSCCLASLGWVLAVTGTAREASALPPPRPVRPDCLRATVAVHGPRAVARLPFDLVDNRIIVHATLNGHGPYALVLDTGADAVLRDEMVDAVGLVATGEHETRGTGEHAQSARAARVTDVGLGPVHLAKVDFEVTSFADWPNVFGTYRIDGVLGYPIFERYVVEIDYGRREVLLFDPATFVYSGPGTEVPFEIDGTLPVVSGAVDGVSGSFGIDIGARSSLILYGPFSDRNGLRQRYRLTPPTVNGWGLGGPIRAQVGRVGILTFGGITVKDVVARLSVQRGGALTDPNRAGLIGPDVLSQFDVWFDYSRRHMILQPTAAFGRSDTYDRSGMWLGQEGGDFIVLDVLPGGPSAAAGLAVGDHVVAVDGRSTGSLLLPSVRLRCRTDPPGTAVHLEVRRSAGGSVTRVVILRDIV